MGERIGGLRVEIQNPKLFPSQSGSASCSKPGSFFEESQRVSEEVGGSGGRRRKRREDQD